MPKFARAICTLPSLSGLSEDDVVNVMHFDGDDSQTWAEDQDDLVDRILLFYSNIGPRLANTLAGTVTVELYDLSQPEPRVPRYSDSGTFTKGGTAMPTEVAVCVSMQGTPESGVNQARRRGRIFVGPLDHGAMAQTGGRTSVAQAVVDQLGGQMAAMAIGPDAGDFRLAVFSPTTFAATSGDLDASFTDVTDIWVDNAFDTQRRRGQIATTRTHFVPS